MQAVSVAATSTHVQGLPILEGKGKGSEITIAAGPGYRAENPEYWAHTDATRAFDKVSSPTGQLLSWMLGFADEAEAGYSKA